MHSGALKALEFDRIVDAVRDFALTPMGDERLARLAPSPDPQKVAHLLAATTETVQFIAKHGLFPLRGHEDLPHILGSLAVEDFSVRRIVQTDTREIERRLSTLVDMISLNGSRAQ